jgi:hypothetical protein
MLDHRHRAQPLFAWAMAKVVREFTAREETGHPRLPGCPAAGWAPGNADRLAAAAEGTPAATDDRHILEYRTE